LSRAERIRRRTGVIGNGVRSAFVGLIVPILFALEASAQTGWQQPPIATGSRFTEALPWAATLEEALTRATKEHRLVLVTIVAVSDDHWVSGYAGADEHWKRLAPPPFGDDVALAIDPGLAKERAMMALWFSDPDVAALVARHFVPVRMRCRPWDVDLDFPKDPLAPLGSKLASVGAPALVIARAEGRIVHSLGRIGVFHAGLVAALLRAALERAGVKDVVPSAIPDEPKLVAARAAVAGERFEEVRSAVLELAARPRSAATPEAKFWLGLAESRLGDLERARALWKEAAALDANGAWGGRAALFAQERGVQPLEWATWKTPLAPPLAATTEADASKGDVGVLLQRAADVLLVHQASDGGWHDPAYDPRPIAGPDTMFDMTVARTALAVDALRRLRDRVPDRSDARGALDAAARRGIDRVGRFADAPTPWIWQATYALHLQVALLESGTAAEKSQAKERAARLVKTLLGMQQDGGWSYMPPPRTHSFNTAPVLLQFAQLAALGVDVPKESISGASRFLASLRNPADERDYYYAPTMTFEPRSATCRAPVCELALLEAGDKSATRRLGPALDAFFAGEPAVRSVTKIYESFFSPKVLHDAYHYYYGHYYAARALARLPKARAVVLAKQQLAILKQQVEVDGSFVDAQAQGKSYSTAMALLTILEDLRYAK
jgi:hypothetical protein